MSSISGDKEDGLKSTRKKDGREFSHYRYDFVKKIINLLFAQKKPV